jgi:predicted acylesterase/phospholipase RssA
LAQRTVVVLGGGNALAAYHAGAYEEMVRHSIQPDWIIGASAGAITAAIIAGNPPDMRVHRLRDRDASGYLPDVGEYAGAVRAPLMRNPSTTAIAIGAIGYLAAYLVHGGGFRSFQEAVVHDDERSSKRSRRRHRH